MRSGTLYDSTRYKSFISERDLALEQVHQNAQTDISRMFFEELDKIENFIGRSVIQNINTPMVHHLSLSLDSYLNAMISDFFVKLIERIQRLRKTVFILTYSAEVEAIARGTNTTSHKVNHHAFYSGLKAALEMPTINNESLNKKIWHALMKLKYKILTSYNLSLAQELTAPEVVEKVKTQAFPKVVTYKKPPRTLKPIREADQNYKDKKEIYSFDFINDEDWNLALSAYKDTELPPSRFDGSAGYGFDAGHMKYDWEVEQEVTEDFVNQVRSAQVDAANDMGIAEFVWVAVIDNKTCEVCCIPRNGKTTSEIEQMKNDDCDATVPPAHLNCRCQIAPIASTDQVEGPDWKSFNDWLES